MAADARSVLVVDDDPAHRYAIGRRLALAGLNAVMAENGEQALRLAADVDAVILDVQLPDITGFEVCRRLREECGLVDLPIIQISAAYVASADLVQGLRGGADAYLTRPVDDEVLVANLLAVLRLRDHLTRVSRELDEKRRIEERARTLFMAMLNHDLRNPLDAISMSAQLLAKAPPTPDSNAAIARRIGLAAARMQHLLDDMQDYARHQLGTALALRLAPQRLGDLAAAAIDELSAAQATVRATLQVEGVDDGVWDGPRLSRVLSNLLRNAVQHGAPGRPVSVTVRGTAPDARVLTVHNEGAAMPDEVVQTLFQPMAPRAGSAPSESNMGLGLFVCKEIVEAHGGTIGIASSDGGTLCTVTLPVGR